MKRLGSRRFLQCLGRWGFGMAVGLSGMSVQAGEVEWRPVARPAPAQPAVRLDRPQVLRAPQETRGTIIRAQMSDGPRLTPIEDSKKPAKGGELIGAPKTTLPDRDAVKPVAPAPSSPIIVGGPPLEGSFGVDGACSSPVPASSCATGGCKDGGWFGWLWGGNPEDCNSCFWLSGEYLMWWTKGDQVPALVTRDDPNVPGPVPLGSIGPGSTATILFGGGTVDQDTRSGARFRWGYWFDDERCFGVDGSFFLLGERGNTFSIASSGDPFLFRPFFDDAPGNPGNAEVVSFDGQGVSGSVVASLTNRIWGGEANLRTNVVRNCWCNLDAFGGFRYFGMDEKLEIIENVTDRQQDRANFLLTDRFQTRNRFYGGQLGLEANFRRCRWTLDLRSAVAIGNVHQIATIAGSTTTTPLNGDAPSVRPGGLLALPSNIGRYNRDRIGILPEVGIKLGYQLTSHIRAFVGYDFMYLSEVARPGEQVDLVLNRAQIPRFGGSSTTGRPSFPFADSDFWAHGLNFGLEFRY